jgi:hypothetical protein
VLRNDSTAMNWVRAVAEAEKWKLFLLEKRINWLLEKYVKTSPDEVVVNVNVTPKAQKKSFFAPAITIHQQHIRKEEVQYSFFFNFFAFLTLFQSPDDAGVEWLPEIHQEKDDKKKKKKEPKIEGWLLF